MNVASADDVGAGVGAAVGADVGGAGVVAFESAALSSVTRTVMSIRARVGTRARLLRSYT